MVRRVASGLVLLMLVATRAQAQLVVIDPANLAQAVLIAAAGAAPLRGAAGAVPHHPDACRRDSAAWTLSHPGDRRAASTTSAGGSTAAVAAGAEQRRSRPARATAATTIPLRASGNAARSPARATRRRTLERQYATIEITDSVAHDGRPSGRRTARLPRTAAAGRAGPRRRRAERPAAAITR